MDSESVILKCRIKSWKPYLIATFIIGAIVFITFIVTEPSATDPLSIIVSIIVFFLPFWCMCFVSYISRNAELTVTDKRVYGIAEFGKRVDIPLDSITAVASSWFLSRIIIASSAGRIAFARIGDRSLAHETINKLLVERQNNSSSTVIQQVNNSNADELRKYKQLYEDGIVTQDEYEAKKKQLLNL